MTTKGLRDHLLFTDIFEPGAGDLGRPAESLLLVSDALQTYELSEVLAELAVMEADGFVSRLSRFEREDGKAPSQEEPSVDTCWYSTVAGQRQKEMRLTALGLRKSTLAHPDRYPAEDVLLAVLAGGRNPSTYSQQRRVSVRQLPVVLHRFTAAAVQRAVEVLVNRGYARRFEYDPLVGPQLTVTGQGLQHFRNSVAARVGLHPTEDVLALATPADARFLKLGLDSALGENLRERWTEARLCEDAGANLSALVMLGSIAEGLLIAILSVNETAARATSSAPGGARPLTKWKLVELIRVAREMGMLSDELSGHADQLRDTRNLVHPAKQVDSGSVAGSRLVRVSREVVDAMVDALEEYVGRSS